MKNRPELCTPQYRRLRKLILNRDSYTCWMCGGRATVVDHLIPASRGGTDVPENLAAACRNCNSRKYNKYNDTPILTLNW
jgi:5-methylcytosine-specific restriction endonuclease McrA